MTQITEVRILLADGLKKAEEYAPPRKAEVEIKAGVAEGGDGQEALDFVHRLAAKKLAELLGYEKSGSATSPPAPAISPPAASASVDAKPVADPASAAKRGRTKPPPIQTKTTLVAAEESVEVPGVAAAAEDSLDDMLDMPVPEKPVTDADLNNAVAAKNAALKQPPLIRKLIGEFNPVDAVQPVLRGVPQERRREFLDRLAELA